MKVLPFFLFILLIFFQAAPICAGSIRFAAPPMLNQDQARQEYYLFTRDLEHVLTRSVQLISFPSHNKIIESLKNDEIDLAILGSLPLALLLKQDPDILPLAQFLNADGSAGYTCSVAVFSGDNLRIEDLKNKHFALTQPYCTCGFLLTESLLSQQGVHLSDNDFEYVGSHPGCAVGVIGGQYSACGIRTSIGEQYHHLGLDLIAESGRLPGFALVANQRTLSAKDIDMVQKHLLELQPLKSPEDVELMKNWGQFIKYGAVPVAIDDFKIITDLMNEIDTSGVLQ